MNIIAIMGPHGVFYKDEPIKELESALVAQGFQIIWPQNSVDLLKFIEHNPRICGVIFDWDEYSLDLCSDINQLNEYLPLYAFINTHSTMDVSVQDMRMALWFFEYALGQAEDIAIRMRQYTDEYLDNITPPFTKALFTYVKERKYTFCTPGHMGGTAYQKSPVGCLFYDFFGGIGGVGNHRMNRPLCLRGGSDFLFDAVASKFTARDPTKNPQRITRRFQPDWHYIVHHQQMRQRFMTIAVDQQRTAGWRGVHTHNFVRTSIPPGCRTPIFIRSTRGKVV